MKILVLLVGIICLSQVTLAEENNFIANLQALIQVKAQAQDAVQAVLELLQDLRQVELDEQQRADKRNQTEEESGLRTVSEYNQMVERNNDVAKQCTRNRQYVEYQLSQATNRVTFIDGRKLDLEQLIDDLAYDRCDSNALFIDALRQHRDALNAVQFLKKDFQSVIDGGSVELAEIKGLTDKFKKYEHLFEKEAVQNFISLAQDYVDSQGNPVTENEYVDSVTGRVYKDTRSIPERIFNLVMKLEVGLQDTIRSLEEHEIQAAWQFAEFKDSVYAEINALGDERSSKVTLIDKLGVELEVARDYEGRCWEIYQSAVKALDSSTQDLQHKRTFYQVETKRRKDELAILDDIIRVFKAKASKMQEYLNSASADNDDVSGTSGGGFDFS